MTDQTRNLITRGRAAALAGVSVRTIDRWLADGRLTKYVDGRGAVSVDADELTRLITPQPMTAAVR